MTDLKKKILEDIKQTGFIAELQVGSVLTKNDWSINHGETYEDKDSQKSREIDIIATKVKHDSQTKLHLEFSLVIDVKRMKKRPWVIFSVDKEMPKTQGWRILSCGYNDMSKKGGKYRSGIFYEGVDKNNFKSNLDRYGIAFHESFKPPSETSKAFESLISVCKAAWYSKEKNKYENGPEEFDLEEETEVYIFIPVVVLDGNLFEVTLDLDGEIKLNEQDFIQIQLNYSSPNYGKTDIDFFPDIIKYEYLEEYLNQTEKWINGMFEEFKKTIRTKYRK